MEVELSAFTLSCNHCHHPPPEFFHRSKLKQYPLNSNSPFLPPLSPWQLAFYLMFLWIWLFSVCLSGLTRYLSFCVWHIPLNVFRVHPRYNICQNLIPFFRLKYSIIFIMLHFVYPFIQMLMHIWIVITFWLLDIMLLWALMYNLSTCVFSVLLDMYLIRVAGLYGNFMFHPFFWLCWAFVAVRAFSSCSVVCRLLVVVASRCRAWTLGCMWASVVAPWGLSSGVWP